MGLDWKMDQSTVTLNAIQGKAVASSRKSLVTEESDVDGP